MTRDEPHICALLGHVWVIKPRQGRLVEICSACGAWPDEAE